MSDELTPDELHRATGKARPHMQAAVLAKRGIAFAYNGSKVRVSRAVAMAYELLPKSARGVDFSQVK